GIGRARRLRLAVALLRHAEVELRLGPGRLQRGGAGELLGGLAGAAEGETQPAEIDPGDGEAWRSGESGAIARLRLVVAAEPGQQVGEIGLRLGILRPGGQQLAVAVLRLLGAALLGAERRQVAQRVPVLGGLLEDRLVAPRRAVEPALALVVERTA